MSSLGRLQAGCLSSCAGLAHAHPTANPLETPCFCAVVRICPAGFGRNAACGICFKGAWSKAGNATVPVPGCTNCTAGTTTAAAGATGPGACTISALLLGATCRTAGMHTQKSDTGLTNLHVRLTQFPLQVQAGACPPSRAAPWKAPLARRPRASTATTPRSKQKMKMRLLFCDSVWVTAPNRVGAANRATGVSRLLGFGWPVVQLGLWCNLGLQELVCVLYISTQCRRPLLPIAYRQSTGKKALMTNQAAPFAATAHLGPNGRSCLFHLHPRGGAHFAAACYRMLPDLLALRRARSKPQACPARHLERLRRSAQRLRRGRGTSHP